MTQGHEYPIFTGNQEDPPINFGRAAREEALDNGGFSSYMVRKLMGPEETVSVTVSKPLQPLVSQPDQDPGIYPDRQADADEDGVVDDDVVPVSLETLAKIMARRRGSAMNRIAKLESGGMSHNLAVVQAGMRRVAPDNKRVRSRIKSSVAEPNMRPLRYIDYM
ncbi:MAG: hypothetical protein ABI220_00030 [Candidatus Saccharimonadales bacterium]